MRDGGPMSNFCYFCPMNVRLMAALAALFFGAGVSASPAGITVRGRITDDGGKPLAGVPVTDGHDIVKTDRRGRYELRTTPDADCVYYTLPAGYAPGGYDRTVPKFYAPIDPDKADQRIDFTLVKQTRDQDRHVLVVWADPQIYLREEFAELDEVVADMKQLIDGYDVPVLALSAGDNLFEKPELIETYKNCIAPLDIPFYHVIGNHDMDFDQRSNRASDRTYMQHFGPSHYAFNVGRVHYVVLKDIFYYGYRHDYIGYLTEDQLDWLERDLADVAKGSTVFVGMHIPAVYGDTEKASGLTLMRNSLMNTGALLRILEGYRVHILSGHSHIQWNTVISDHIIEHTHGAASGAWWQGPVGLDGTPKGYTVYEIDGSDVSWYFKGAGFDRTDQFRVYVDGPNVVVNVYNYDPEWRVELFENGRSLGEMERYWGADPMAKGLYPPGGCKLHRWLCYGETHHLFRGRISDPEAEIRVVVTDRFGNVYERRLGD